MTLPNALALFAIMAVLAAIPSTSVAIVVSRSAWGGVGNGAAVAAGIVVGDLIFVLLAIVGMAAMADTLGDLFLVIRLLAGGYLIWLGVQLIRQSSIAKQAASHRPSNLAGSFLAGLTLTLADIKALFFYASLFPLFVDLARVGSLDIVLIVLITLVAVGGVKLAYAYGGGRLRDFARNHRYQRLASTGAGVFMVGAGLYLIANL